VDSGLPSGSFDVVVVSFGLHHVHPDTDKVILEFHRVLKKGGLLCFAEPHRDSLLDKARRFWYKCDKLFAKNERAIDLSGLKERFGPYFQFQGEHYGGSAAYLLVLNSMIFRIPQGIKKYYTRSMFILESMIGKMQGSFLSGFVICQWRKI
jgi:ubiquinone/menaquinone biosynthesis C-methylase UbiE